MRASSRGVWLGSVLALSACGGREPVEGEELAQRSSAVVTPAMGAARGCSFMLEAIETTPTPPSYNVVLTRVAGGPECPHPSGVSRVMGTSYGPR